MTVTAQVGRSAPEFRMDCVAAGEEQAVRVSSTNYRGRWLMLFFYPRDLSFVCPTELTAFSARVDEFGSRDCDILGVSVDSIELHREWLATPNSDGGLGPLQFPLGSDPGGATAQAFGTWNSEKQVSSRGTFLIDPDGILQYAVVHNLSVGRAPEEVLRVLDALQTGGLCPASWTTADGTIDLEGALRPGSILGHYRIRKSLGGGAFGNVFAGWDMRLERMVALKVLRRNLVESRAAAVTEARAAARLNHPNVCSVYAVEEQEGLPVIVMEYLDGQPLTHELKQALSVDRATRLARQIASGLAAAHQQQVVHGDLKPANIMVNEAGEAKILDFGLARSERAARAQSGSPTLRHPRSQAGQHGTGNVDETLDHHAQGGNSDTAIRGTPAYMSPEQAGGRLSTPRSDVFSLGVVLCEMLTGRDAYDIENPVELVFHLQSANIAEELASRVAPPYRPLLGGMLQREPDDRPTAEEVSRMLASLIGLDSET